MFLTALILNYCLTSFAHVIPRLLSEDTGNMYDQNTMIKVPSQFHVDNFIETATSHSPSPGQPHSNPNMVDASRTQEQSHHQSNDISKTLPRDQEIDMERLTRIEFMKQKVLKELQLTEPPNATEPIRLLPPEIMQSLADHESTYHNQQEHLEDERETTRVFVRANTSGKWKS